MSKNLAGEVLRAQSSMEEAENLIKKYKNFILAEASKVTGGSITESHDEFSIGMLAFHEAIKSYKKDRGKFISFAGTVIKNRIIDFYRSEKRHLGHASLHHEDEDGLSLEDRIEDKKDYHESLINMEASKKEILELKKVLEGFDLSLEDIGENSPRQERTHKALAKAIAYAVTRDDILKSVEATGKVPMTELSKKSGISKKTLERHRRYLLTMILIYTNGYYIIRDHVSGVLSLGKED